MWRNDWFPEIQAEGHGERKDYMSVINNCFLILNLQEKSCVHLDFLAWLSAS